MYRVSFRHALSKSLTGDHLANFRNKGRHLYVLCIITLVWQGHIFLTAPLDIKTYFMDDKKPSISFVVYVLRNQVDRNHSFSSSRNYSTDI